MDKSLQSEGKSFNVQQMIESNKKKTSIGEKIERIIPTLLFLCAAVSVVTTVGILFTFLRESIGFFSDVSIIDFYTGSQWSPWSGEFGVAPLIGGTLLITLIATIVAVPLGLMSAIFLSEYASDKARRVIKPVLEVLAGIPTVVYGYFALTFVTPMFQFFLPDLGIFNALSGGFVVGIMILPMVASLSEDAMNSVPNALREAAYGLGSTKLEVVVKVVLPAAFSGIVASIVLAISRAIGETMIVTIAAGATPNLTLNPTESIQTMTAFIVQAATGDTSFGSTIYYSLYAVGMTLFVFTLVMNLIAQYISRKFREEY
ncbi:phosphate ABC transporter membrane protein 1, PhoT family [Halobacillus karajensis]|uniref:Phosphate transport system permease protein n=1 Tax=Halobacillus karajensis TaxID=195088 RepID=A0A024P7M6_9BACI|nr:phosphate ABC transporter permease subunit PstC [Halobacillus karajensis]CDQ18008.1 Phosphate transport system permease protein PstC [Halobacillus karajensis]CDQ24357.1 Phosphate transport system permease protein PstC [Halobacillus karajensis]CDQ29394.1 Phosphate transport system permease protein PstC [Halobacillus karajensis]SEH61042.1 phosphate ABC transporter membrane protein 1, PhoT family [Halobacillus karajensis]